MDSGLKLQNPMLEASRQSSNTNLILTSLSNLLLAVNPRSGKPDHMLNVVKFVIHSWRLPAHGLHAIGKRNKKSFFNHQIALRSIFKNLDKWQQDF